MEHIDNYYIVAILISFVNVLGTEFFIRRKDSKTPTFLIFSKKGRSRIIAAIIPIPIILINIIDFSTGNVLWYNVVMTLIVVAMSVFAWIRSGLFTDRSWINN